MTESQLHQVVCDYIKVQYRDVTFRTDYAAGMKLTPAQAVKHKRMQSSRAFPDLFVYEPRSGFHGLAIEIKRSGTRIYKKNGDMVANMHIREQALMLYSLNTKGYMATFGVGFDHIKKILDEYLALPKPNYKPPDFSVTLPEGQQTKKGEVF